MWRRRSKSSTPSPSKPCFFFFREKHQNQEEENQSCHHHKLVSLRFSSVLGQGDVSLFWNKRIIQKLFESFYYRSNLEDNSQISTLISQQPNNYSVTDFCPDLYSLILVIEVNQCLRVLSSFDVKRASSYILVQSWPVAQECAKKNLCGRYSVQLKYTKTKN